MSIGTFTLIKNEIEFIGPHIMRLLPVVDRMVFFDGNSSDGTLETIKHIKKTNEYGFRIKLVENKDPKDLRTEYVKMFNDCLQAVDCDWAYFAHPDFWILKPDAVRLAGEKEGIAMYTNMESYAGDPGGQVYRIEEGRGEKWKNIYRLKNPALGAHYWGWYGSRDEDVYFSAITGAQHVLHNDFSKYPYDVSDSGIGVMHFSDIRHYERRLGRMKTCLENQGYSKEMAAKIAPTHPRVTLKSENGFKFTKSYLPKEFLEYKKFFEKFKRGIIAA